MLDFPTFAGILLVVLTVVLLVIGYSRATKRARLAPWGWAGAAIILLAEVFLLAGQRWVAVYFTPMAWTGYLLLIDGAVWSLRGESRLGSAPREFLALAFWSVPLWLIFEAYNLRLANWTYVGLPANPLLEALGYVWSFATIWPAIFETADLVEALSWFRPRGERRLVLGRATQVSLIALGTLFVALPVLVPVAIGQYLFGAVWVGFVLLLDPINYFARERSLLGELEQGRTSTLYSFLASGFVCGVFWEFWNYWAAAKWVYVFPIMQSGKVFEMPLAGFLGFMPFALECFVMYEFLRALRRLLHAASGRTAWRAMGEEGKASVTR
ncbi:MAG: hypothetical protein LAO07_04960 [Acidobacteriia bacterium]|nr:hypothetical protein [Terriglobia bacterium]